jgi:4-hydroxy 2-oxovalerate aldolase
MQLLDCTLRDGGYLVGKRFSGGVTRGIIDGLTNAGVNYVEIGFLQDDYSNEESVVFKNSAMARKYIPADRKNTVYTAFADYSRYSVSNLDEYDGKSFDAVRACFFHGERGGAMDFSRAIKEKGYRLFMQPAAILKYSHRELLDLIDEVNKILPESIGIVDTFGSMYIDDLHAIFSLLHHNLDPNIKIDFHSHNNMQMSSALSQTFLTTAQNKRGAIVDSTLTGMGRGAGNCPTELIVQFMNSKLGKHYNLDIILDLIDTYLSSIQSSVHWGYSVSAFLAGAFSAHVNNVTYLSNKASLRSQDIRYILNRLTREERSRYFYDRLDELYRERFNSDIDDTGDMKRLKSLIAGKTVLIVAPGGSASNEKDRINRFIAKTSPVVISVNFIPKGIKTDYIYFNNARRFDFWSGKTCGETAAETKSIITSNVRTKNDNGYVISLLRLIKSGWNNFDNSVIMLLRLIDFLDAKEVALAGFDGFSERGNNYAETDLEKPESLDASQKNIEIERMFKYFLNEKKTGKVYFITPSYFDRSEKLSKYKEDFDD